MSQPLDVEQLKADFLNNVYDEREFKLSAETLVTYAKACGERAARYTDPTDPEFQAPPTIATSFQAKQRMPTGFPKVAGLGMDAGKAVESFLPIKPDISMVGKTHMHDIYTKTGRSGRMVFFVLRMEVFDPDNNHLASADTSVVIREKPE